MMTLKNYLLFFLLGTFISNVQAEVPVYNIMVTSIRNISNVENKVSITCNLLNLSGKTIILNDEIELDQVNFKFEESFSRSKLFCYKSKIVTELLQSNLEIAKGKILKFIPIDLPLMEEYAHKSEDKSHRKKKVRRKKKKNDNTVLASSVKEEKKKRKRRDKEEKKNEDGENEEFSFSASESIENSKASHHLKDLCVDIVIDTIIIKKRTKKYITIEYTLSNQGKAKADFYGEAFVEEDNLALKVFLGRSENITRGSIPVGGGFIERGLKHGILNVGKTYTGTLKLSTKNFTRFTPYIIVKLDPFNILNECHRRDNNKAIKVGVQ